MANDIKSAAYIELLSTIKARIASAQYAALKVVNKELIPYMGYRAVNYGTPKDQKMGEVYRRASCQGLAVFFFRNRWFFFPKYLVYAEFLPLLLSKHNIAANGCRN